MLACVHREGYKVPNAHRSVCLLVKVLVCAGHDNVDMHACMAASMRARVEACFTVDWHSEAASSFVGVMLVVTKALC